ncbi:MAG TPA: hypothetical protein VMX55_03760 [candidate division Zixibacteria bacterium]|nr:hypothetical protein [candidate division Zixibacteria bacterium]
MSVFDRSYRTYEGELKGRLFRIWSIARSTFRVQFSGKRMIFLLIFCNLPVLAFTLMLIFMAIFIPFGSMGGLFGDLFGSLDLALYLIIITSFNSGSIFMPIVFIAALNSGSIANDKKNNSLALYMSKPIDRIDYTIGKAISVLMVNSFVTYIPWFIFMVAFSLLSGITGSQFIQTFWVYFAALGAAMVVNLFIGSIVLLFSSMSNQTILAGILTILVLFLPSVIVNSVAQVVSVDWLNYFSISSLITSCIYIMFGKPTASSVFGTGFTGFIGYNINGFVSLAILLGISIIAFLLTVRNLNKEEIQ